MENKIGSKKSNKQKKSNKYVDINSIISIITLNINDLNILIKRWKMGRVYPKTSPNCTLSRKPHFKDK